MLERCLGNKRTKDSSTYGLFSSFRGDIHMSSQISPSQLKGSFWYPILQMKKWRHTRAITHMDRKCRVLQLFCHEPVFFFIRDCISHTASHFSHSETEMWLRSEQLCPLAMGTEAEPEGRGVLLPKV